jgi:hypothetical protein
MYLYLDRKQLIQRELEVLREREASTAIENQRLTDSIVEMEKVWSSKFVSVECFNMISLCLGESNVINRAEEFTEKVRATDQCSRRGHQCIQC